MTGNEQSHQVFRVVMHSPIPDLSSIGVDVKGVMETMRGEITGILTGFWNASLFISNGASMVQSASAGGIQFQLNDADNEIPYKHIDIVYDVDVRSDPTWIEIGQIILLGAGVITTIVGILTANPVLVAAGVIIAIASILLTVYEVVHEIITVTGGVGGGLLLLAAGGIVLGYFIYTETGRARITGPIREGVSRAGRHVGGQTREGLRQIGSGARKHVKRTLKRRRGSAEKTMRRAMTQWH